LRRGANPNAQDPRVRLSIAYLLLAITTFLAGLYVLLTALMWYALRQRSIEVMQGLIVDYMTRIDFNNQYELANEETNIILGEHTTCNFYR